MKKQLAILMILALLLGCAACGAKETPANENANSTGNSGQCHEN